MPSLKESELIERLKTYPEILQKVEELLNTIERRDFTSVDSIEEALIPDVRGLGKILMASWAFKEEESLRKPLEETNQPHHSKKNSTGIQHLET